MNQTLFNPEAEASVIGSVLIDPNIVHTLALRLHDFYVVKHQWIWGAIKRLTEKRLGVDLVTVCDELERDGKLAEVGGPAYLTGLISQTPTSLNAEGYAEIILDYSRRRSDVEIANLIAQGAHNGGVDRAKVIDLLTRNAGIEKGASPVGELLNSFYSEVEERSKDPRDVWGIPSGLPILDKVTGGWHPQQTTMIAGSPGVGKTTMLLQFVLEAAKRSKPTALYELEMDNDRLIGRLVSMLTGVPVRDMKTGRMENHWPSFNAGIEQLERLPLYISDYPVMNTMQVRADVARLKNTADIELVGLDYLNLLTDKDNSDKHDNTTDKAVRFRSICREFQVAGVSVQSVTKEGMRELLPTLASMSGPAELSFTADNVFFLVQDKDEQTKFQLLPAKLRDGDMGRKPIDIIKPQGKLLYGEVARF